MVLDARWESALRELRGRGHAGWARKLDQLVRDGRHDEASQLVRWLYFEGPKPPTMHAGAGARPDSPNRARGPSAGDEVAPKAPGRRVSVVTQFGTAGNFVLALLANKLSELLELPAGVVLSGLGVVLLAQAGWLIRASRSSVRRVESWRDLMTSTIAGAVPIAMATGIAAAAVALLPIGTSRSFSIASRSIWNYELLAVVAGVGFVAAWATFRRDLALRAAIAVAFAFGSAGTVSALRPQGNGALSTFIGWIVAMAVALPVAHVITTRRLWVALSRRRS